MANIYHTKFIDAIKKELNKLYRVLDNNSIILTTDEIIRLERDAEYLVKLLNELEK